MKRKISNLINQFLAKRSIYIIRSLLLKQKNDQLISKLDILKVAGDYIRYANLMLCVEEIIKNNLSGQVAELGVYRGDFAKRLNILFPSKKLYLFDTFEGFSKEDVQYENKENYSSGSQDFSDTSIELVKAKMEFPENCIFKKGKFPETTLDLEEQFCFVSIDADLFMPIYEGLKFFYPRLVDNGYIYVHDFNNKEYPGAREAVVNFCKENNIGYTPIPDAAGTVIITK